MTGSGGEDLAGPRILVAEDQPNTREFVRRQLTRLGYECDLAADGAQAFALFEANAYALILTDCQMPEMNGYELAAAVRAADHTGRERTPIVALTAVDDVQERCIAAGMNACLEKPVPLRMLGETIAGLTGIEPTNG